MMKGLSGSCRTGAVVLGVAACLWASAVCKGAVGLTNGVPVVGISGTAGSEQFYAIVVPEGQDDLVVSISGGSGDCDLYVRKDVRPGTTEYDYRPYLSGNEETVTVGYPEAGTWYIMLRGFSEYANLTLDVRYSSSTAATVLTSGVAVEGLWGEADSEQFYQIEVPEGWPILEIGIFAGTGDCDLYLRKGAPPTTTLYDYRPFLQGNDECVIIRDPDPGIWHIMLKGHRAYANLTLLAVGPRASTSGAACAAVTIAGEGRLRMTTPGASGWSPYINNRDTKIPYDTEIAGGLWPTIVAEGLVGGKAANASESHQMEWMLDYAPGLVTTITADFTVSLDLFSGDVGNAASAEYWIKLDLLSGRGCNEPGWDPILIDSDEIHLEPIDVADGTEYSDFVSVSLSVDTPTQIIDSANNAVVHLTAYARAEAFTLNAPDKEDKTDGAMLLANGTLVAGLTGEAASEVYYKIEVPAKQARLEISTAGGFGDVDLYVRRGLKPTVAEWDYRSHLIGNDETIVVNNPRAGTYFILLRGSEDYSDATLMTVFSDARQPLR
jgi:hypothetical protein